MSQQELGPNNKRTVNPNDLPPLEPTAEVPVQHRDDHTAAHLDGLLARGTQAPPKEYWDTKPEKSRKGLYATVGAAAAAAVAVGAFGAAKIFGTSDNEANPTPNTTPTAAAPETPGTTAPSETVEPTPTSETTLSPELQALAASVTPEKLAAMTPEQLKEAFTINIKELDPNDIPGSYFQQFVILKNARQNAGFTDAEWQATLDSNQPYSETMRDKYFYVSTAQLFGNDATQADPEFFMKLHNRYNANHGAFVDGLIKKDYLTKEEIVPNTLTVTKEGDGTNDSFSVSGITRIYDVNDVQKELEAAIGDSPNNAPLNLRSVLTVTDVKADKNGNLFPASTDVQDAK